MFFPVGALTASWSKVMISPEENYEMDSSEGTQYSVLVRAPWPHYLPWPSSPCSLSYQDSRSEMSVSSPSTETQEGRELRESLAPVLD